ncbi:MAG: discoidin domain-containing protein [Acetatifactor sp.]|nr:discoidin domain-containing protein [Acetatifactor sp.]
MKTTKAVTRKLIALVGAFAIFVSGFAIMPMKAMAAENLAYMRTATASSVENSSLSAANAVDANGNTRWASSYADNQNLIIDLWQTTTVSSVKIAWEAAYAASYQVQVSNDYNSWTTVYSNYNSSGGTQTINFTPVNARYVKLYCIHRATQWGFSVYEFEIYGSSSGSGSGSSSGNTGNHSAAYTAKQNVLNYLYTIKGSKTVIGIHNREPNSYPAKQTDQAHAITGQYAGLWSGDFLYSSDDVANRWTMINEAKIQWNNGCIVQLMLHVTPPTQSEVGQWNGGVCSQLSDSQWNDLITNGGSLNRAWKARLDIYANYLQYLEDNGVPVLFRPFHEMNQSQFWWAGRTGYNGTAALFRLTKDYLENEKGLDNLIWVWDMQDLSYNWSDYNPGNNYWDIFAVDIYNSDRFTSYKYNLANQVAGNKLIAIGECDKLPTAQKLAEQPNWSFVMSWAELTFSYNTNSEIQNLYWATNVLIRDELPDF